MTVTDLLQVVPTRLTQACLYNKLLLAYYYQSGNNLIRANMSADLLEQLVASLFSSILLQDDDNLFSASQQLHAWEQATQTGLHDMLWEFSLRHKITWTFGTFFMVGGCFTENMWLSFFLCILFVEYCLHWTTTFEISFPCSSDTNHDSLL